jgi:putative nucleotidyltransferase with HDIG domain
MMLPNPCAETGDMKSPAHHPPATEHLLIATSDIRRREFLRKFLSEHSPRFKLEFTDDSRTLRRAIDDESISAVVTDGRMAASLGKDSPAGGAAQPRDKPIVIFPTLSQADFSPTGNPRHLRRYIRQEMKLFMDRLNHAVSQWRRGHSDRRRGWRNVALAARAKDSDPMCGFVDAAALGELDRQESIARERRQILGCVVFKLGGADHNGQPCDRTLYLAARTLRQTMRQCDLGVCLDESTLGVLRPSSPLGECWIWAESAQKRFDGAGADQPGRIAVVGVGVREIAAASASQAAINSAIADAARSVRKGGCVQTPVMSLLEDQNLWKKIRAMSVADRRAGLLEMLQSNLGHSQLEHVGEHCEVVSRIGAKIAMICGLDDRNVEMARLAGLFHDIGKVVVPNDILGKPGPLTGSERTLMMKHVHWGADISRLLGLDAPICEAVRDHHARFEHAGYGVGLFARIVSAADAIGTMLMNRDYRSARPVGAALQELRRQRGKQFDPIVVDAVQSDNFMVRINEGIASWN